MKVIHLISGGDSGGAKTHVLSLLQNLNKTITAQLICFRDGPFAQEARAMGIPTEIMAGNQIFRIRRQLAAYIREGGYQIIHCHGSRANMIGSMLRKTTGLPVVSTIHSDYRIDYMGRPLSRLTFGTINALALRRLDYRIGVSDAMVELLISRGFTPDRFYAIYNGIDFTPPPDQGDRLEYLRKLGADVDEGQAGIPGPGAGRGQAGHFRRVDLRRYGPLLQRPGHQHPHLPVRDLFLRPDRGRPLPSGHCLHCRGRHSQPH